MLKVGGKLFAAVQPGYHLDKRHWITVTLDGTLPDAAIEALSSESYALVIKGLSHAARQQLVQETETP